MNDLELTKTCTGECGKELPVSDFYKLKSGKYGVCSVCKECIKKERRSRNFPRQESGAKYCNACKQTKSVSDFYSRKTSQDGLSSFCKICSKKIEMERRFNRKNHGKKRCSMCKETKFVSEFGSRKRNKDGLNSRCGVCVSKIIAKSKKKNGISEKEKIKNKVRDKTKYAVKKGRLSKLQCKRCDSPGVEAHHAEYESKDSHMNVTWLCRECHEYVHYLLRKIECLRLERLNGQANA